MIPNKIPKGFYRLKLEHRKKYDQYSSNSFVILSIPLRILSLGLIVGEKEIWKPIRTEDDKQNSIMYKLHQVVQKCLIDKKYTLENLRRTRIEMIEVLKTYTGLEEEEIERKRQWGYLLLHFTTSPEPLKNINFLRYLLKNKSVGCQLIQRYSGKPNTLLERFEKRLYYKNWGKTLTKDLRKYLSFITFFNFKRSSVVYLHNGIYNLILSEPWGKMVPKKW